MNVKIYSRVIVAGGLLFLASAVHGETLRKRYTFPYDRATRKASSMVAATNARKRFLRDFLAEKFSPDITNRLAEDIDVALDPPDQYLASFNVVSERLNEDETQVTLTVEGDVDLAEMISALVQNKVLSFGKIPPKVMVLPSSRFEDPRAAKTLRALIYDKVKQAGLSPVAFENISTSTAYRIKEKVTPTSVERQALIRQATQYGADYLIYIDAEVETKPFSQGGFIADGNFIHTILRPNGSLILGEAVTSERGSGSSPMLAFDRALDSIAPTIAKVAIGQLFQSIYSDSDVVYNTPQLRAEKTIMIHWASAPIVQAIVKRLEESGNSVKLGTGTTDVDSRVLLQTTLDDFGLYEWFNAQTFGIGGKYYKTPVVAYSENVIEVEAVAQQAQPHRKPIGQAPPRRPRKIPVADGRSGQTDPGALLAKVTLKLRPAQFNR